MMSDGKNERLELFRQFLQAAEQGAEIPAVDDSDLKALHELCVERAKRYCGKDGVISLDLMARACHPNANLPAVWLRHRQLRTLYREGLLAAWQHGSDLKDCVFRLAARVPMRGTAFGADAFLERLRRE